MLLLYGNTRTAWGGSNANCVVGLNIHNEMLSRFLYSSVKNAPICLRVACARLSSTNASSSDIKIVDMNYPARLHDWENFKMPGAPYEGMGPTPPLPDYDESLTRHYIIPEYWFQFLYPRTGATGLYALFAGMSAMLLSKEYYIYTHETWHVISLIIVYTMINKMAGPSIKDFFETMRTDRLKAYDQVKGDEIDTLMKTVDEIKLEQWRAQGQDLINDARRSNLAMMLETEYLNRQATVAETLKKKLDYQVAVQKLETELEQNHMVKWIENKVRETITPETQKATLSACIAQLNAIAAK